MKINGSLVFDSSAASEIQNLRIQKLSSLPTYTAADAGRLIYTTDTSTIYYGSGTANNWASFSTGGNIAGLQAEVDNIEAAVGAAISGTGSFQSSAFSGFTNVTSPTSITNVLQQLDAAISGKDALAELVDVAISAAANKDILQYDSATGKWKNLSIGAASGVQAYDAGLDALAAKSSTGLLVQTGANSYSSVSLTAPAAGLTISNADGTGGNPTFALANDLAALEGLTTTGVIVRTGDGTAVTRNVTGTAGRITVTNPSGLAGDIQIDLGTVAPTTGGNFTKLITDTYGRVTQLQNVAASDITILVDPYYLSVSGGTLSGQLSMSNNKIINLGLPVNANDAASKAYVDSLSTGLSWKTAVRVASTANITLSAPGASIDGVTLSVGDRVLVKDQTTQSENGIYSFNGASSAMTRTADMTAPADFDGSAVFVKEGSTYASSGWTETATVTTVGTSAVVFSQFTGGAQYNWGTGLSLSGNIVNVNLGAGITEGPTDEVGIDLYSASGGALILTENGAARSTGTAAKLHLLLDGNGSLTQSASGLSIGTGGVTNAMLQNPSLQLNSDSGNITVALGGIGNIKGTATQGISTSGTGGTITITAANATSTQKGVATFNTGFFTVTAGDVTLNTSLDGLNNVSSADAASTNSLLRKSSGDWVAATPAQVASTMLLDDIGDVAATPTANHVLVGTGSGWQNKKIFHLETVSTSSTSWVVTHGIGQKYCNVTVVDNTDEVVIPQSIVFNSTTQLTVTFNTALTGKVIVMGLS